MSEIVKNRSRGGTRRSAPSATDDHTPEPLTGTDTADAVEAPTDAVSGQGDAATAPVQAPEAVLDGGAPQVAEGVVGWADAVPWLALRWGSAPTAMEVRFAPVVWRMLQERPGRTTLQLAAEAELDGYTDLDPSVLARVLSRYQRAGVAHAVTDGRLSWWSVVDPAEIIADAQESAHTSVSATRAPRVSDVPRASGSRVVTPAGGLRGLVEDHLSEHPFEDFSPSQVAKALGKSSGAVANALDRLAESGTAIQTSQTPRRYQHRPDQDGVPATGTGPHDTATTDGTVGTEGAGGAAE